MSLLWDGQGCCRGAEEVSHDPQNQAPRVSLRAEEGDERGGPCRPLEQESHKLTRPVCRPPDPAPHAPSGGPLVPLFPSVSPVPSLAPARAYRSSPGRRRKRGGGSRALAPRRPAAGGSGKGGWWASPAQPRRPDRGAGSQGRGHVRGGAVGRGQIIGLQLEKLCF